MNPQYRLYTPHSVVIATIMGSLFAGAVLIALNYRALGRTDLAGRSLAFGVIAVLLVSGLGALLPGNSYSMLAVMVLQMAIAYYGSRVLQWSAIEYHVKQGGQLQSPFWAMFVGLMVGFGLFALLVVALLVSGAGTSQ